MEHNRDTMKGSDQDGNAFEEHCCEGKERNEAGAREASGDKSFSLVMGRNNRCACVLCCVCGILHEGQF